MPLRHVMIELEGFSFEGVGVLTIERAVAKLPGVTRVYANPATEMADVDYDPTRMTTAQLAAEIERTGFSAGEICVGGKEGAASTTAEVPSERKP